MTRSHDAFRARVAEIEAYLAFVSALETRNTLLLKPDRTTAAYESVEQGDLLRTLRASAFLLLYNLMESTVTNAIEAIFDELKVQGVAFDNCSEKIRLIVLKNVKQSKPETILPTLHNLALDIVARTFQKKDIVSGNVDAKKIRELAENYGFAPPQVPQVKEHAQQLGFSVASSSPDGVKGDGEPLVTVKMHRNNLAHGSATFADIGKDYTHNDVLRIKCEVIAYLDAMRHNVAKYLTEKQYQRNGVP